MKSIIFFLILGILVISGCLSDYSEISITNVDVMSVPQGAGAKLTITPYIQNNKDTDSGTLSVKVKVRDPSTNLIVVEKNLDMGYIKSRSTSYNNISLVIPEQGEYLIEVQLFEGGKLLTQYSAPANIRAKPVTGQPADIKLTDMNLVITKIVNDGTGAVIEVSPGIFNQGGDSMPLTLQVTARVDPYNAYTERDELGIVKGSERVRGKVVFLLPKNKEYDFGVSVIEEGKTVVSSRVDEKINLNKIRYNTLTTFVLVEEGKPKPTLKEPGFEAVAMLFGIIFCIILRSKKKRNK